MILAIHTCLYLSMNLSLHWHMQDRIIDKHKNIIIPPRNNRSNIYYHSSGDVTAMRWLEPYCSDRAYAQRPLAVHPYVTPARYEGDKTWLATWSNLRTRWALQRTGWLHSNCGSTDVFNIAGAHTFLFQCPIEICFLLRVTIDLNNFHIWIINVKLEFHLVTLIWLHLYGFRHQMAKLFQMVCSSLLKSNFSPNFNRFKFSLKPLKFFKHYYFWRTLKKCLRFARSTYMPRIFIITFNFIYCNLHAILTYHFLTAGVVHYGVSNSQWPAPCSTSPDNLLYK